MMTLETTIMLIIVMAAINDGDNNINNHNNDNSHYFICCWAIFLEMLSLSWLLVITMNRIYSILYMHAFGKEISCI